jgi:Ion channel
VIIAAIIGVAVILLVAQDVFETIVLPRRVTRRFRIARAYYRTTWKAWRALGWRMRRGGRRESYLGYFGPLSLLALFALWALLLVLGFALLFWGLAIPLNPPQPRNSFSNYLYFSGTTFFTLGLGDISPVRGIGRALVIIEVASGFGFLALVISYMPVIYQAFSRRELRITLLDARAGAPATAAELLCRNCVGKTAEEIRILLRDWEAWCADILESHLSYPVLAYYRSQHDEESWLGALTVILDTCALIMTGIETIPAAHARFAFATARHAVVDLAQVFGTPPRIGANRLSSAEFVQLREVLASAGVHLMDDPASEQRLAELRATYEPFVTTLAEFMFFSLPPWIAPEGILDDWQTSAWDDQMPSVRPTLLKVMHPDSTEPQPVSPGKEHSH